jgi:hypothetical protein
MPTRKKTPVVKKKKVRKTAAVKQRQKQKVSVTVNVNSNNKRKVVATKRNPEIPSLNPIIQVPMPYNNSQFMQSHGIEPTPRHEPVRVPIEPIPEARELLLAPVLPPIRVDSPEPMLHSIETIMTPLPFRRVDIPTPRPPTTVKPQIFTPPPTRANLLQSEARRIPSPIPRMNLGVEASTSTSKINLPQIREFAERILKYNNSQASAIRNPQKKDFIDEYGQQIQDYLNSLK